MTTSNGIACATDRLEVKLEAVAAGLAQFEDEFLAYVVDPTTNGTVGDQRQPQLEQRYLGQTTTLPGPRRGESDIAIRKYWREGVIPSTNLPKPLKSPRISPSLRAGLLAASFLKTHKPFCTIMLQLNTNDPGPRKEFHETEWKIFLTKWNSAR